MDDQREYYKQIGARIRKFRERAKLSQVELGEAIKVSSTAISLYENGDRYVSIKQLHELADLLKVTFEELSKGYPAQDPDISYALRADKKLRDNPEAQKQILDFIDWVKHKPNERSKD